MKHIDQSPIDNSELTPFLSCKDYTVSGESFAILKDNINEFLVTSPRPIDDKLGEYYKSEDYISHSDSKKSLLNSVYKVVRNYTIKRKVKLINSFNTKDKFILDIGAGTGDFLLACKNDGWIVEGVEPSNDARKIAEKKLSLTLSNDVSNFTHNNYDVITMWHVLEHIPDLNQIVSDLKKMLKPNGVLVIAVPNHKSYDAEYYKEYWAAYDVPRHLWHFSKEAIANLFSKVNMKVIKILPMKFDAFYVSLLSEKYKRGSMNPFNAFYIGARSNMKAKSSKEYSSLIYILKND